MAAHYTWSAVLSTTCSHLHDAFCVENQSVNMAATTSIALLFNAINTPPIGNFTTSATEYTTKSNSVNLKVVDVGLTMRRGVVCGLVLQAVDVPSPILP